jgi:hypothetical protein
LQPESWPNELAASTSIERLWKSTLKKPKHATRLQDSHAFSPYATRSAKFKSKVKDAPASAASTYCRKSCLLERPLPRFLDGSDSLSLAGKDRLHLLRPAASPENDIRRPFRHWKPFLRIGVAC